VRSAAEISRPSVSFVRRHAFVGLGVFAACFVLSACSPGADYPSLFPAVHDIPPPRSDAPLDRNQVQQATEDLISARDRLSAEAQSAQGKNAAGAAAKSAGTSSANAAGKPSTKSSVKSSAKSSANSRSAAATAKKPSNQVSGPQTPAADAE
jgi:hypothetical protein